MATEQKIQDFRIDQFHSGPGARADHWRFLVDAAKAWSDGSGKRNQFDVLFAEIEVTEEFHGYPGPRLMAACSAHVSGPGAPPETTTASGGRPSTRRSTGASR